MDIFSIFRQIEEHNIAELINSVIRYANNSRIIIFSDPFVTSGIFQVFRVHLSFLSVEWFFHYYCFYRLSSDFDFNFYARLTKI